MLMTNVLAVAAGLLMGFCRIWKPHIMVISGRAVMGFYCGTVEFLTIEPRQFSWKLHSCIRFFFI